MKSMAGRYTWKILSFLILFAWNGLVWGATAGDYTNAGNQLYSAKNYSQAIQYFSASLSLDPNNAASLQGRANCYYSLGQYPQALADYEKVQTIAPSDSLAQFIQSLRAKVGSAPAGEPAAPGLNPSGDSFNQGVALYQQQQYAAAVPYFQKAVQENPDDSKGYYYLGVNQMMLGDAKNAAVNLGISDQKQPNPAVASYVTQLKTRLSPEDQQWVDGQLTASRGGVSTSKSQASFKKMGVRLQPAFSLITLNDFTANAEANQAAATTLRSLDPTFTFSAEVPTGCINMAFEGFYRLSPNLELGLPIGLMAVGKATDTIENTNGFSFKDSFEISALTVGLNIRYLLGNDSFQPYISAGPLVTPMSINYTLDYTSGGTASAKGSFSSMGFGGQVQLGLDWHLGDSFAISPFAGFQLASANNFSSTVDSSSGGGTAVLSVIPDPNYGKFIYAVANGVVVPFGSAAPPGTTPLTVDLSGLKAGLQILIFF